MFKPPAPKKTTEADAATQNGAASKFEMPTEATVGEKFFGHFTYTGIGYLLNLGVSVALWDFLMDGPGGGVYKGVAKGLGVALKSSGMKAEGAQNLANTITKMSFSPLGGHFTMIPLKIAEDHARFITHKANCFLDKNYKYKDLDVRWNTPEDDLPPMVAEPTEATWGQTAIRRGIGWAAVTTAGTALNKVGLEAPLENGTLRAFNKGVDMLGSPSIKNFTQKPLVGRYIKLTALDSYFTVITASIAYMTNNLFGEKHGKHHKEDVHQQPVLLAQPTATEAPTEPATIPMEKYTMDKQTKRAVPVPETYVEHAAIAKSAELSPALSA